MKEIFLVLRKDGNNRDIIKHILNTVDMSCQTYDFICVEQMSGTCDLIVAVGGDGTFIDAAHTSLKYGVPLIGINAGSLGFLTEIKTIEVEEMFREIHNENYELQERIVLSVSIVREGRVIKTVQAINECALIRRPDISMVSFQLFCDKKPLSRYRADGIVISTPTGSTAYNLSLQGPILYPTVHSFVINAIAPHSLTHRPIVLPSKKNISLTVEQDAFCSLVKDGQTIMDLLPGDIVCFEEYDTQIKVLTGIKRHFFEILSEKLHFGRRD